jgi:hypothetical protein
MVTKIINKRKVQRSSPFLLFVVTTNKPYSMFCAIWPYNKLSFRGLCEPGFDGSESHSWEREGY